MQTTTPAPSASASPADGFQRVGDAPQMQSGEALLVEAYAFIWVVLFGLVLATWLRQRSLDGRMRDLEGSIARARNPRPPKAVGARAEPGGASPEKGA